MWITFRRPSLSLSCVEIFFFFSVFLPTPFSFMNAKIHDDHSSGFTIVHASPLGCSLCNCLFFIFVFVLV